MPTRIDHKTDVRLAKGNGIFTVHLSVDFSFPSDKRIEIFSGAPIKKVADLDWVAKPTIVFDGKTSSVIIRESRTLLVNGVLSEHASVAVKFSLSPADMFLESFQPMANQQQHYEIIVGLREGHAFPKLDRDIGASEHRYLQNELLELACDEVNFPHIQAVRIIVHNYVNNRFFNPDILMQSFNGAFMPSQANVADTRMTDQSNNAQADLQSKKVDEMGKLLQALGALSMQQQEVVLEFQEALRGSDEREKILAGIRASQVLGGEAALQVLLLEDLRKEQLLLLHDSKIRNL